MVERENRAAVAPISVIGRRSLCLGLTGLLAVRPGAAALAASYPDHAVRLVVGFTPGGGIDVIGRLLAKQLTQQLGQSFFVDNRPGADGAIGGSFVARSDPDGYNILLVTTSHVLNAITVAKPDYDAIKDFTPVTMIASFPNVLLVNAKLGVNTVAEFIQLLKASPGKYNFASTGVGGATHLAAEAFQIAAGVKMVHVPYSGPGPALLGVMTGDVAAYFGTVASARPLIGKGDVKLLAVTSENRVTALPDVPSATEVGLPGLVLQSFYGVLAPAHTPKDIVDTLRNAISAALNVSDIHREIEAEGATPSGNTPDQFGAFLQNEIDRLRPIAKQANLVPH